MRPLHSSHAPDNPDANDRAHDRNPRSFKAATSLVSASGLTRRTGSMDLLYPISGSASPRRSVSRGSSISRNSSFSQSPHQLHTAVQRELQKQQSQGQHGHEGDGPVRRSSFAHPQRAPRSGPVPRRAASTICLMDSWHESDELSADGNPSFTLLCEADSVSAPLHSARTGQAEAKQQGDQHTVDNAVGMQALRTQLAAYASMQPQEVLKLQQTVQSTCAQCPCKPVHGRVLLHVLSRTCTVESASASMPDGNAVQQQLAQTLASSCSQVALELSASGVKNTQTLDGLAGSDFSPANGQLDIFAAALHADSHLRSQSGTLPPEVLLNDVEIAAIRQCRASVHSKDGSAELRQSGPGYLEPADKESIALIADRPRKSGAQLGPLRRLASVVTRHFGQQA